VKLVELAEIEDAALLAETIERFRREADTLTRLHHPNIVSALEAGRVGNELFLVMELAEGVSLSSMLEQRHVNHLGLFPVPSVLRIVEQACAGLSVAHAAGVVHRDIKPSNLMVATRLHIKIIDFGIARLLHDNSPRLTLPTQAIGTLAYISPEQLGGVDVDGRADLYSLGCVIYELLSGRPPFMAEVPTALLRMQLQERAVPLDRIRADLPPSLSQLVDSMMEKDRTRRPGSAAEVLQRVQAISAGLHRTTPEHEADRQTISRVTAMGAGAGGAALGAQEADRATVFASDPPGRPQQQQPPAEAHRGTQLTPERLADLSGTGTAYPGAFADGVRGYQPTIGNFDDPGASYGGAGGGRGATMDAAYAGPPPGSAPTGGGQAGGGQFPQTRHPDTQHPGTQQASGPAWPDTAARPGRRRRRRSPWRGIISTLVTLAIVGGVAAFVYERSQHPALKVSGVSVALASAPKNCSGEVAIIGTIVTNGTGGQVTYEWTRNSAPEAAATVTNGSGQDSIQVTLKWTFTGTGSQQATVQLQVLSPNQAVGNTQFTYSCAK
jgi:serine/threonine-protein kinase